MAKSKFPAFNADQSAYNDFTPDVLAAFPLTDLAEALRSRMDAIILAWTDEIRSVVPAAKPLPFEQLVDGVPGILDALTNALNSVDSQVRRQLLERSPTQGIERFKQHYAPRDLMLEDRLLRRCIARHAEDALNRPMTPAEYVALGMGLDLMSQQAVIAYIEHQNVQLRSAAEAELQYLSFLSHDLNNNLSSVTLWLQVLKFQLQPMPNSVQQIESIDHIQQNILTTIGGMGRLLQAERMRHGGHPAEPKAIDLAPFITGQTSRIAEQAGRRGVRFVVDVPAGAKVLTDPDLLTLVLQNLIGNAAKFAVAGTVRVSAERSITDTGRAQWTIAVTDEGPGIPPDHVQRIFIAFQRATMQGEAGVGLGLAIASRAASLLGGSLTVSSEMGVGSVFTLTLPDLATVEKP